MAVPASGILSLQGTKRELATNNYNSGATYTNIGLTSLSTGLLNNVNPSSNRPNGSQPHNMSEWYAYDHDLTNDDGGDEKKK